MDLNSVICFISGAAEASNIPETPREEEDDAQILTSSREKIQAFVQESLDAHEEFLQSQSTQGPNEHQPNSEHVDAEQPDQGLQRGQLESDDQEESQMEKPVREEKEGVDPELQESIAGKMLEAEKAEDNKQQQEQSLGIHFMRNEAEREQVNMSEEFEKKQPSPVRAAPPEADQLVPAHGPGPLVTELEDAEQLETIHLPLHRSLCIDDLPDLEDVDTEDFIAMFSSQQVFRPKIQVLSGGDDEDEPLGNQSEGIPTFGPDKNSGSNKSTSVSNKSSSLMYPEDDDAFEPLIFEPVGKSKTNQTSSPPRCLIEELE